MKKLFLTILVIGGLSFGYFVQTAKAQQLYTLGNGDTYDVNGTFKCLYLMDGNCYDNNGGVVISANLMSAGTGTVQPSFPIINPSTSQPLTTAAPVTNLVSINPCSNSSDQSQPCLLYQQYQALKVKCDADDASYTKQIQDTIALRDQIVNACVPFGGSSSCSRPDLDRQIATLQTQQSYEQKTCKEQLANLQP